MTQRFLTLSAACLTLLAFSAIPTSGQTLVNFDDISTTYLTFPGFVSQVDVMEIQLSPMNKGVGRC
jgi:hypothetical protein